MPGSSESSDGGSHIHPSCQVAKLASSAKSAPEHFLEMGMDQYLLIPFLGEWTSIYQLFWCLAGVQGFDTLPNELRTQIL